MCAIIHLLANQSFNDVELYNAACNNWHSWGIIVKKDPLLVIKKLPDDVDKGGGVFNHLDEIKQIIEENKQYERIIHFRYANQGEVNENNIHPFNIYNTEARQTYMAHNGTFYGVVPHNNNQHSYVQGQSNYTPRSDSDTKIVCDTVLIPSLSKDGFAGDYTNPVFQKFIWTEYFKSKGGQSKVIFVANDLEIMRFGPWITMLDEDKNIRCYVSNDDYFKEIIRGPVFLRLKEEETKRKEQEAKEKREKEGPPPGESSVASSGDSSVILTKYVRGCFNPDPEIVNGVQDIIKGLEHKLEITEPEMRDLLALPIQDIEELVLSLCVQNKESLIAGFINHLLMRHYDLFLDWKKNSAILQDLDKKVSDLTAKKEIAEKMIATLKKNGTMEREEARNVG